MGKGVFLMQVPACSMHAPWKRATRAVTAELPVHVNGYEEADIRSGCPESCHSSQRHMVINDAEEY
jgi:hypothetical protein